MKYLFLLLCLVSCTKRQTTTPEGKIVRVLYNPVRPGEDNIVEVFTDTYGVIKVFNSPYINKIHIGDMVNLGCSEIYENTQVPTSCQILEKKESK
jgi:hypothetical protein